MSKNFISWLIFLRNVHKDNTKGGRTRTACKQAAHTTVKEVSVLTKAAPDLVDTHSDLLANDRFTYPAD